MNIYVGNLSNKTTEETLEEAFGAYGYIHSVRIVRDENTGESKGYGFVAMPFDEQGRAAMAELNGREIDGRAIRLGLGKSKKANSRKKQKQQKQNKLPSRRKAKPRSRKKRARASSNRMRQ